MKTFSCLIASFSSAGDWLELTRRCINCLFMCLWLVVLPAHSSAAVSMSDVPVPPGAVLQLIDMEATHNGQSLSMATFDAPQSVESTVAFYEQAWLEPAPGSTPGMLVSHTPEWVLLSRLHGGYNTVVQLSNLQKHRSVGFVSIMSVEVSRFAASPSSLDELQLLSETVTDDVFSTSRLSVSASMLSVASLTDKLIRHRESADWRVTSRQRYGTSQVVLMSGKEKQLELVVSQSESGGSMVVANEVDFDD